MSAVLDRILAADAKTKKPAPPAKPNVPMTLGQAQTVARKKNPMLALTTSQAAAARDYLRAHPHATAAELRAYAQAQDAKGDAAFNQPAWDWISKASNAVGTPQALFGAELLDYERARQRGLSPFQSFMQEGATSQNAQRLLRQKKLGELGTRYGMQSLQANKARAATGQDPAAAYFQKHPRQFGVAAGVGAFVDPTNIVAGEGVGAAARLTRGGISAAARAAARVAERRGFTGAANVAKGVSTAARTVGTLDRFASVKTAAEDVARERGLSPADATAAGQRARTAAVNLANAQLYGRGKAEHAIREIFGEQKWTRAQLQEFARRVEGTPRKTFDPQVESRLTALVDRYRTFMARHDTEQVAAGALDPARQVRGTGGNYIYVPRKGAWVDDKMNQLDEAVQEYIHEHRSSGGSGFRVGTANKNIHRVFPTIVHGEETYGAKIDPLWNPAETIMRKIAAGGQNIRINQAMAEFEKLGLIQRPALDSYGKPIALRSDFVPHAEIGSTRTFGAPALREGTVEHPAINQLIEDVTPAPPPRGFPSTARSLSKIGEKANSVASLAEVSNFLYHPVINEIPSIIASAPNPIAFARALLSSKAVNAAIERGVVTHRGFTGSSPAEELLATSDLTKEEKIARAARAPGRLVATIASQPLYGSVKIGGKRVIGIEPRLAAATFEGLRKRLGDDKAFEVVRQIVGEPENLKAGEREASQLLQFPAFVKAMVRYWGPKLARNPGLYRSIHAAVAANNLSRGVGPSTTDSQKLVPDIALRRTKEGAIMQSVPSPANRALQLAGMAGNAIAGHPDMSAIGRTAANIANPLLNVAARVGYTAAAPAKAPDFYTLWDKDNPDQQALPIIGALAQRYAPVRGGGGPLSLVGLGQYTRVDPARTKLAYKVEMALRQGVHAGGHYVPGIEAYETQAKKLRAAGNVVGANRMTDYARRLYKVLQAWEAYGAGVPPMKNVTPKKPSPAQSYFGRPRSAPERAA